MTYLTPYDSTDLAKAGVYRAREFAAALGQDLVVVTVVPSNKDYARENGWIEASEPFDADVVEQRVREEVATLAPDAAFRCLHAERHVSRGSLGKRIRRVAEDVGADVLVVGSENAGRIATPAASIGGNVAASRGFDVFIVRTLPDDPAFRAVL